ncbi:hypothetical protein M3Y96_00154300 [Aphelenchoides besseyi]|nr:hypothetical protein M3Y96_00154300 [Aphelenchoides besseyi]
MNRTSDVFSIVTNSRCRADNKCLWCLDVWMGFKIIGGTNFTFSLVSILLKFYECFLFHEDDPITLRYMIGVCILAFFLYGLFSITFCFQTRVGVRSALHIDMFLGLLMICVCIANIVITIHFLNANQLKADEIETLKFLLILDVVCHSIFGLILMLFVFIFWRLLNVDRITSLG